VSDEYEELGSLPQILFQFKRWPSGVVVSSNGYSIEDALRQRCRTIVVNNLHREWVEHLVSCDRVQTQGLDDCLSFSGGGDKPDISYVEA
jgi:hypothetical protein